MNKFKMNKLKMLGLAAGAALTLSSCDYEITTVKGKGFETTLGTDNAESKVKDSVRVIYLASFMDENRNEKRDDNENLIRRREIIDYNCILEKGDILDNPDKYGTPLDPAGRTIVLDVKKGVITEIERSSEE